MTEPVTPREDPALPTDEDDPGHLLPGDAWARVVADAERDAD